MVNAFYIDAYMKNGELHGDTYGHEADFISEGCSCGIICSCESDDLVIGDILKLADQSDC